MALELRQQLKLQQQLVMTQQLQQAIKLLQLSRFELLETVQQELLENPFLEESPHEQASSQEEERSASLEDSQVYEKQIAQNADWEDYLGDFSSTSKQSSSRDSEISEEGLAYDAHYATRPNLESHLLWQLRLSRLSDAEKNVGEVIFSNLSSAGYLQATVEEVAQLAGEEVALVERVLAKVQRFDPVGVACRTAQECLLVQIQVLKYDRDPILVSLITEHLEDIEAKRFKPLLRKFKLNFDDLKEYLDIIQGLDPLPGASFGTDEPLYVSPDVFVYGIDGDFIIALNDDGLPQLQLSSLYEDSLQAASGDAKEYFKEKMRSASWLIKSLHQRQRTLYKVMESIVRFQKEFFINGVSHLRPLILKDVADDISMHESTVSRITSNKYTATPYGIFELKYFFNSALSLDDGSEVGSESVKALLKKYISDEDPKSPLSDERLGELLKDDLKVNIARRTVAKYRTALNIPSSSKRRAFF